MVTQLTAQVVVSNYDESVGSTSKEISFEVDVQNCSDSAGGFDFDIIIKNTSDSGFEEVRSQSSTWQRTFGDKSKISIIFSFEKIYDDEFISDVKVTQVDVDCFD